MARHDSQLARSESVSIFGGPAAAIHRMLLVAFLGHRGATVWFAQSILPEPIEAVGAKLGISHRMHDVAVAQEVLQRAGIDAVIC
jgi:hypothetical protein